MNTMTVAFICAALIATPAGYAVERLMHTPASTDRMIESPSFDGGVQPIYAEHLKQREQMRIGELFAKPGRV
jgi:hypothetical protein